MEKATWIKQDLKSNIVSILFLISLDHLRENNLEEKPYIFRLLKNKNNQGNIITHTILYAALNGKLTYKKILLIMQTTI